MLLHSLISGVFAVPFFLILTARVSTVKGDCVSEGTDCNIGNTTIVDGNYFQIMKVGNCNA